MPYTNAADELAAKYEALARTPPRLHDDDHARSRRHHAVNAALEADERVLEPSARIVSWVVLLRSFERFESRENRLPRENNRLPPGSISDEERTLAEWRKYQLRAATRERHCDYQRRRLESIPGFTWTPLEDRWNQQYAEYVGFVEAHREPRRRSPDPLERRLAAWWERQRRARSRGTLPEERAARLTATPGWRWSATRCYPEQA
ncbi:hypothetical protein ABIB15_002536 [Marisediminicola sp. UYEF4]|uniref:helicase associated domain-containing protein n=1 Tax=Marisediminicola sp. UYEF4 TaxID=1756384 RepID=UPI003399CC99